MKRVIILKSLLLSFLVLFIFNGCGSDSASGTTNASTLSSDQETQSGVLCNNAASSLVRAPSSNLSAPQLTRAVEISCPTSGSMDVVTGSLEFMDCLSEYDSDGDGTDDTSILSDGTLTYTNDGTTQTATFDSLSTTITNMTTSETQSTTMSGTVAITIATNSSTANLSGTVNGTSYSVEGTVSYSTPNVTIDLCLGIGSANISCSGTVNATTATPATYSALCSIAISC